MTRTARTEHIEPRIRNRAQVHVCVSTVFVKATAVVLTLGVIGAVSYGVYDAVHVPEYTCESALQSAVEVRLGKRITISSSSASEVCTLEGSTTLGRSYGGHMWEKAPASEEEFSCTNDGKCSVFVPADSGTFRLTSYNRKVQHTSTAEVARFLMQATFGPTQADLDSWGSTTYKYWISDQMGLPPSLHRAYLRRKSSPRTRAHSLTGRPRKPCENLSRWHRHAFTLFDLGNTIVVTDLGNGNATLDVNGVPRTEVRMTDWSISGSSSVQICTVEEKIGGGITFGDDDCSLTATNPALYFSSAPTSRRITINPASARLVTLAAPVDGVLVLRTDSDKKLDPCSAPPLGPVFLVSPDDGQYYQHDGRLVLLDNTRDSPVEGVSAEGPYCVSAPKTFLNKDSCVVGGRSCNPPTYSSKTLTLDDATLRSFYTEGGHYVYRIDGLTTDAERDPCNLRNSRWIKVSCESGVDNDNLTPRTLLTFQDTFARNTDTNPLVKDISVSWSDACDSQNTLGATLDISGVCWRHSHPHAYNIYDFSRMTDKYAHLGKDYVIQQPADLYGSTNIFYPASHPYNNWYFGYPARHLVGRYMDDIDFAKLPWSIQSEDMVYFFGLSTVPSPEDELTERCGSPGEVANDPSLGARIPFNMHTYSNQSGSDSEAVDLRVSESNRNKIPWVKLAVSAEDQLRQRMAFALSGILVVTEKQTPISNHEHFVAYYDIFVRHAFGNYRDVLKEVSYHPLMAIMLTYDETKSFEYSLRQTGGDVFPDENYAREVMQLFTIGLDELRIDGTKKKDGNGNAIETYTNADIMAFSRVWTGFKKQSTRGNIEGQRATDSFNTLDPMQIVPEYRDQFPKMNLYGGHIGDGYPLCVDLPDKMFLRKGAEWTYLGTDPMTKFDKDPPHLAARYTNVKRVSLEPTSALYNALCNPDVSGKCRYKSTVELEESLACNGIECEVDALRAVNISNAFYEFVRRPCIRFPFFNDGKTVQTADGKDAMCAHPREIVAAEACCDDSTRTTTVAQNCLFAGERLSFAGAQERCAQEGKELCDFTSNVAGSCYADGPHWTTEKCDVRVKISSILGSIAVVHEPEVGLRGSFTKENMRESVRDDSRNWFRVAWANNSYPSSQNGCKGICEATESNECICSATVTESAVFNAMPSRLDVLKNLHVGSVNPHVYDSGEYTLNTDTDDVKAYVRVGGSLFDKQTVFKVIDKGEDRFFVNMESKVTLTNGDGFRNPANLMGIVKPTARDAHYETDALIDHLFQHDNCAPFISYRIIQRFVTSNPSPRYVDVCAKAFISGKYEGIGSGKYGDLGALIAAVLLDREARESILDSDPSHGQLKEPLLKVIHMFRSLEIVTRGNREFDLVHMEKIIEQNPHAAPGVFSFFKPEYAPPGPISFSGLVAPEAEIFTAPTIVNMINGLISLVRVGLTNCYGGFGLHFESRSCTNMATGVTPPESSPGMLRWTPRTSTAEGVVDELALLLTAGRLDDFSRAYIVNEFKTEAEIVGFQGAVTLAKQLLIVAPEFHMTNHIQRAIDKRREEEEFRNGTKPFKAIVYLMLVGGADSFNLIVPHSDCKDAKDMYQEYQNVRTNVALSKDSLLPVDVPSGEQVCNRFGIHPEFTILHELYNQRDAMFMANVGPLVEPVTKLEVIGSTKRLPMGLFAHNVQQEAVQTMFPQRRVSTGVLGHMNDALLKQGYSTGAYSTNGINQVLEGDPGKGRAQVFVSRSGSKAFDLFRSTSQVLDGISSLNELPAESIYGESWASSVSRTLAETEHIGDAIVQVELEQSWTTTHPLGLQLQAVAKLIKARGVLGNDRQTFFTVQGGFDTHSSITAVDTNFRLINEALTSFVEEMKLQGVWDNVLLIESSDFARTITSNGKGTDHGWGGNYFMLGGSLQGGTMIGEYPDDLTSNGATNLGRGRILPTTSWDEIWNGISLWFGVEQRRMKSVLPNRENFGDRLVGQKKLFGTEEIPPYDTPATVKLSIELIVSIVVAIAGVGILGVSVMSVAFMKEKTPEPSLFAKLFSESKAHSNPRHVRVPAKSQMTTEVSTTLGEPEL